MEDDSHLFNAEDKKFTDIGYKSYWNAVDKTVKFAHTLLLKKEALASQKKQWKEHTNQHWGKDYPTNCRHKHEGKNFDRFHWSRKSS